MSFVCLVFSVVGPDFWQRLTSSVEEALLFLQDGRTTIFANRIRLRLGLPRYPPPVTARWRLSVDDERLPFECRAATAPPSWLPSIFTVDHFAYDRLFGSVGPSGLAWLEFDSCCVDERVPGCFLCDSKQADCTLHFTLGDKAHQARVRLDATSGDVVLHDSLKDGVAGALRIVRPGRNLWCGDVMDR